MRLSLEGVGSAVTSPGVRLAARSGAELRDFETSRQRKKIAIMATGGRTATNCN